MCQRNFAEHTIRRRHKTELKRAETAADGLTASGRNCVSVFRHLTGTRDTTIGQLYTSGMDLYWSWVLHTAPLKGNTRELNRGIINNLFHHEWTLCRTIELNIFFTFITTHFMHDVLCVYLRDVPQSQSRLLSPYGNGGNFVSLWGHVPTSLHLLGSET